MFPIIYLLIGTLLSILGAAFVWFRNSLYAARNNKRHFYKPILVLIFFAYVFSRVQFAVDIVRNDTACYTKKDLTPRRKERFERYVKLQEKTYYIDRYNNMLHLLKEDDRPLLSDAIYFLTCSRRMYKFRDLVWQEHLNGFAEEQDLDKMMDYIKKVKWLSLNELTKRIKSIPVDDK